LEHRSFLTKCLISVFLLAASIVNSGVSIAEEKVGGLSILPRKELERRYDISVSSSETTFFNCKIEICATGSKVSVHLHSQELSATEAGVMEHAKAWYGGIASKVGGANLKVQFGVPKVADLGPVAQFQSVKVAFVEVEFVVSESYKSQIPPFWMVGIVSTKNQSVTIASSSQSEPFALTNALDILPFAISRLE